MCIAYVQECDLSNKKVEVQATFLRSGQEKIAQLLNAQDAYEGRLKQADNEKQLLKVTVTHSRVCMVLTWLCQVACVC